MKEIILTKGQVALVDDGDFEWLNQWKWFAKKDMHTHYAGRTDYANGKRLVLMHRLILGLSDPEIKGEHRDNNGLNNQRSNLRTATQAQNASNVWSYRNSTSGYLGVSLNTGRGKNWRVQIKKHGVVRHLGYYDNEIEAAKQYDKASIELHGEFGKVNFPESKENLS